MNERAQRVERLRERYGARAVDTALQLRPSAFPEAAEWWEQLDPHYTKLWLNFDYGMYGRNILDTRTHLLLSIGQGAVLGELEEMEADVRGALAKAVPPREILEVVLHARAAESGPGSPSFPADDDRAGTPGRDHREGGPARRAQSAALAH